MNILVVDDDREIVDSRVAQKCGMTYEGTKREYFKTSTGKFVDIVDYAILKSEWEINK